MKKYWLAIALIVLFIVGLTPVITQISALGKAQEILRLADAPVELAQAESAQVVATMLGGKYSGAVKLAWSLSGVYTDNLATPTPQPAGSPAPLDLGSIDLSLQISQTGNALSGYVDLEKTMVFSVEHTLPGTTPLAIGPYVQGTFDGANLTLTSERVTLMVAGRSIQRQFSLVGVVSGDGTTLSGEYRETLWGYARQPITVVGEFSLQRPVFGETAPPVSGNNHTLYLPVIQR